MNALPTASGKRRIKSIQKQEEWLPRPRGCARRGREGIVSWGATFKIPFLLTLETWLEFSLPVTISIQAWSVCGFQVTLYISTLIHSHVELRGNSKRAVLLPVSSGELHSCSQELMTPNIVPENQERFKHSACIPEHSQFSRPDFLSVPMFTFLTQRLRGRGPVSKVLNVLL